ncbi:hypothetical protein [Zunongwangia sp. H14]|uniref:hypothetical protein n=1 Tax=Zunongwangia sp. H14 TaxID=3240792 RepID=UPI00356AB299
MKRFFLLLLVFSLAGCHSAKIVNTQSPGKMEDRILRDAVIIGITSETQAGSYFENRLEKTLEREEVHAVSGYDSLTYSFQNMRAAEEALEKTGTDLLAKGYKTVLISKIEDVEERPNFFQFLGNVWGSNQEVPEDANMEKKPAPVENDAGSNKIYHSNTEVYALTENGKTLIWSCSLELKNPRKFKSSVKKYIKALTRAMEKDHILPED